MRTLQEKYNGVINENFSKKQFVRDARLELPNLITQFNGFEDTVTILKSKGMLQEAKKQEVPEYDKPAPGYSLEALERGIDAELEGMGINTAVKTPAKEDYDKAKEKAEKNLEKDPNHYLNLMSGDSKKVDKHDKYVEVKKNNHVDTFNGMKKAELKEGSEIINEGLIDKVKEKLLAAGNKVLAKLDSGTISYIKDKVEKALGKPLSQVTRDDINIDNAKKVAKLIQPDLSEETLNEESNLRDKIGAILSIAGISTAVLGSALASFSGVALVGIAMIVIGFLVGSVGNESVQSESGSGAVSLKEEVIDLISFLKKERGADNKVIMDFIKMHFKDIRGASLEDILDEFDNYLSVNTDYIDEKKEKHYDREILAYIADTYIQNAKDGDRRYAGFLDLHIGDAVQDVLGILQDPKHLLHNETKQEYRIVQKDKAKGLFEKKGKDHDGDGDIDGDDYMAAKNQAIKKAMGKKVNEGRRSKMKGGKVVTENDYETGGYVESMGPMLDRVLKQLIAVWDEWKEGPMTEPGMIPFAKKDLLGYIGSQITEGEDIVDEVSQEHEELKEAFKAIISRVLTEEVITEAATGNLSSIASKYDDYEGMQAAINTLENIVTDVESYYAKTKEKIQKVYDSFKDIRNAEGLAVGALIGPAIEDAFRKDLMPVTEKGFTKGLEMPKVKMLTPGDVQEEELEEKETVFKPVTEGKKYKYTKRQK